MSGKVFISYPNGQDSFAVEHIKAKTANEAEINNYENLGICLFDV